MSGVARYQRVTNQPVASVTHPDAQRNYSYAQDLVKRQQTILENVKVVYDGINKDFQGNFEENVSVSFYWKQRKANVGYALSFHQPETEFKTKLNKFLKINENMQMPQKQPETAQKSDNRVDYLWR